MFKRFILPSTLASGVIAAWLACAVATAQEPAEKPAENSLDKPELPGFSPADELPDLVRLAKDQDAWFDAKRKLVVVDGQICLRQGQLEMFACNKATKEHESVVSLNAKPMVIHAGLLRVGAVPGKPVQFDPKYVPASGTVVDVWVLWRDKDGKKNKVKAQEWIRQLKTGKAMTHDWVFGGSGFWTDEETMQKYYQADAGDVICVSNFPTAMLDLPVASSAENADLQFEAFTDKIPEKGTKVRLVLIPRVAKKEEPKKDAEKGTK